MKIKFTLLAVMACCIISTNAQVMITENFNNQTVLTANGWIKINNSSPAGSNSWFTGNAGVFPALSAPDTAYVAANYNNTSGSTGTISNWLITPTVTVNNGGIIQFATRTNTVGSSQTVSPDRLQVYLSLGTATSVGATASSLGTFTTLLVAVNPNLTPTGYPTAWTVYSTTLSGITGTVSARFGFRYSVTSAGPSGINSSYIGIDNVKYDLPCPNPTLSITSSTNGICSGTSFSVSASGANTYTWNSGQNTPSVTLSPTATTIYTLTASSIPNCNSTATVAITVTQTPVLSVLDVTTCAGTSATLSGSGASSYSWSTGSTSPVLVVTPTINTTYTLDGSNGVCSSSRVSSVTLGSSLSIFASSQQSLICSGKTATVIASGGNTYTYTSLTFTNISNGSIAFLTPASTTIYTVSASSGSCSGTNTILISVNPSPTVIIATAASSIVCPNSAVTFTASGAASFLWSDGNSINPALTVTIPSTSGTFTYGVVGTATNGCSTAAVISRSVTVCTSIENLTANANKTSVYPNPFTNELRVLDFAGRVEVYNALGQAVIVANINNAETINTSSLSKGIYLVKTFSENNKLIDTIKVIKN